MCAKAKIYSIILVVFGSLFVCSRAYKQNDPLTTRRPDMSTTKSDQNRLPSTISGTWRKANSDARTFARSVEVTPLPTTSSPSRHQRPRKWVTQIFTEAANQFELDVKAVSAECRRDYELYKSHLQNQTVWAVRMLESSQWPSVGIFSGTLAHLGNYDECLWINANGVKGQYCLAEATYDYEIEDYVARQIEGQLDFADETKPAWNAMKMYLENPVRVNRHKLSWALCIPSTCKSTELNASLNTLLVPLFSKHGLNISVNVNPIMCMKKEPRSFTKGYYIVSSLYAFIFALILCSTFYETTKGSYLKALKNESVISAVFRCFSLRKNWMNLVRYDKNKDDVLIHLTKICNMMLIIYGHRFIYFIGYPKASAEYAELFYKTSSIELIHTNVVDVFFMISGFLTFTFGLKPMMKGGVIYLVLSIIFRWIRMIPLFMILLLFIVNILPFLNDAPLWNFRINNEVENCATTWWTNVLAVSNIVRPDKQCLVISWYISADIQLTIIGSILLLIICKKRILGGYATLVAFVVGAAATFTVAYVNNYHGLLRLYMNLLEEPRNSDEFTKLYVSTYNRLGPYLLGFGSAFIVDFLKQRMFIFSARRTWCFFLVATLIGESSQFYGCLFYLFGREYNRVENATYAALSRSLFVFPYAVTYCMHFTSGLGKLGKIIQLKLFVVLGRITYPVFLVNTLLQLFHASSQKNLFPTSRMNLGWLAITDIVLSYFFGFLFHMFAEAPICNMSKLIQQGLLNMFMKQQKNSDPTSSDVTGKINEGTAEKGKLHDKQENVENKKNGCINQTFDATETPEVYESSVANETESSRC